MWPGPDVPSRAVRALGVTAAALMLAACSGYSCRAPQVYQAARSVPPLIVPEDLTDPDDVSQLEIPRAAEDAPQPGADDPCLDAPPDFFSDEEALEAG